MTTVPDAFLQDIVADPADDAPRLIFADWLDEHGDPERAEFIRGQIALEGISPGDPRRADLAARMAELERAHGAAWSATLCGLAGEVTFRRGFVAAVTVSPIQFYEHGEALLRRAPIEGFRLTAASGELDDLLGHALFRLVERLEVRGHDLGDAGVERLVRSPNRGRFAGLLLHHCGLTERTAALLREMPLDRLAHLNLGANDLHDAGVTRLFAAPDLVRLEYLGLGGNELRPASAWAIAAAPALRTLLKLNLGANYLDDDAIAVLARAEHLGGLTDLDVRYNEFGNDGARALAESPVLGNLTRLDVTENAIGPDGLQRLRARFGGALVA